MAGRHGQVVDLREEFCYPLPIREFVSNGHRTLPVRLS